MKIHLLWYFIIVVCTIVFTSIFAIPLWFQMNGLSALSSSDITDIAKTKLVVDATLFGLSTLSGAIFLGIAGNRQKTKYGLTSTIIYLMGISFLSFVMALCSDFLCLGNLDNKLTLVFSMGLTISGAISGSLYLVWTFANYLETEKTEKVEPISKTRS